MRVWLFLGALNGLIAVCAGAYGWHELGGDDGAREMFDIGVQYQMMHALGLLAVSWLADNEGDPRDDDGRRPTPPVGKPGDGQQAKGMHHLVLDADVEHLPGAVVAGIAFVVGIVLFSGSLYAFAITGVVPVEGAAPAGGFAFILGWLALMWTAARNS